MSKKTKTKIGDVWGVYEIIGIYRELPNFFTSIFRVRCTRCGRESLKSGRVLRDKPEYCTRCSSSNKGKRISKKFPKGSIAGKYKVLSDSSNGTAEVECLLCGWKGRVKLTSLYNSKDHKNRACHHGTESVSEEKKDRYFDIFFSDLNEDAQKRLMDAVGIKDPSEMNWDIDMCPIGMYPIPYNIDILTDEVGEVVK